MMISGFYKSFDIPTYVHGIEKETSCYMLKTIKACALSVSEHLNHAFFCIIYITQNN